MDFWFRSDAPNIRYVGFRLSATILAKGNELLTDMPGEKAEGTSFAIPPIPPTRKTMKSSGSPPTQNQVTIYQLQPHAQSAR